jgi:taurine dehydrogenase large subunit
VIIATNGYSTERLHPALNARLVPVLSNIIVTRPLDDAEERESRIVTTDIMSDTRAVLNYYRRLPDGRIMLGSRGPISESSSNLRRDKLLDALRRKFPALRDVTADYCWGGWVALTMDQLPHIHTLEEEPTVSYALGYNGSGVSAAVHAGRRLAQHLVQGTPILRKISTALPRVPFPSFRRVAQRIAFAYFRLKDRG